MPEAPLLSVTNLSISAEISGASRPLVTDVTFDLAEGASLGIVGESGSGKSVTLRSLQRLLAPGLSMTGQIEFRDRDVYAMKPAELRKWRSSDVAMIYQDPRAHINPVRTVGDFLTETLITVHGRNRHDAAGLAVEQLRAVGVGDASRRLNQYPHELSGGLLQRVMIAASLLSSPQLLLADEPTTALDVTTQEEVMAILNELRQQRGLATIIITHDLELAAAVSDNLGVLYAGQLVEMGPTAAIHRTPLHPYTSALLQSRPPMSQKVRLQAIPGRPRAAYEIAQGCRFADGCAFAQDPCRQVQPELRPLDGHLVACHRSESIVPQLTTEAPQR